MHCVIKRNLLLEIRTTVWNKINFRAPNTTKCRLCGIAKRVLGFFFVAVHRFMQKGKRFNFRQKLRAEFWSQAGIGEKVHQWLETFVATTTVLLLLRTTFKKMIFQSSKFLMLNDINSCCTYFIWTTFPFLVIGTTNFQKKKVFLFFGVGVQEVTLNCFFLDSVVQKLESFVVIGHGFQLLGITLITHSFQPNRFKYLYSDK